MDKRHIISLEVQDKPGVLSRISTLFSRRGYNIDSLTVGHTHKPGISRFTIVVHGDETITEQIRKQSQKLIQVLKTESLDQVEAVMREFALIKIACDSQNSKAINEMVDLYGGRILATSPDQLILEFSGSEKKINRVFGELEQFKVLESIRTGKIGMKIGP